MSQFDVYVNTNSSSNKQYPFLLDIQHAVLSVIKTRIVIPLCHIDKVDGIVMDTLTPTIRLNDQKYVLMTPQIAAVPDRLLNKPVGTLEHSRAEILAALDFAITGV